MAIIENLFNEEKDKKVSTLESLEKSMHRFLNKKTSDTILILTTLFMLYTTCMNYGIKQVKDRKFDEGQKKGIELMRIIYSTPGGNEALRYFPSPGDYLIHKE